MKQGAVCWFDGGALAWIDRWAVQYRVKMTGFECPIVSLKLQRLVDFNYSASFSKGDISSLDTGSVINGS